MVHLVPDDGIDDGPVLATAVVDIDTGGSLEAFETTMHAVEHSLLVGHRGHDLSTIVRSSTRITRSSIEPIPPTAAHPTETRRSTHDVPRRSNVNDEFFDRFEALTFDDVVVVPGYSETLPDAVDTSARFAADIELAVPLVSAAMDKVTEGRMAVAMARHGGIGVIHRNMSIDDQAAEVQKVKRSQSGMITDPVTLPPDRVAARCRGADAPVQVLRACRSPTPTAASSASSPTATSASARAPTSTARSPSS